MCPVLSEFRSSPALPYSSRCRGLISRQRPLEAAEIAPPIASAAMLVTSDGEPFASRPSVELGDEQRRQTIKVTVSLHPPTVPLTQHTLMVIASMYVPFALTYRDEYWDRFKSSYFDHYRSSDEHRLSFIPPRNASSLLFSLFPPRLL